MSICRSIAFFGSMTWPPLITRSNWACAEQQRIRPKTALRTDDPFLCLVPRHVFSFSVRLHAHLAGHPAVIPQHAVAFERLVRADGCLQIAMMQRDIFAARLLMCDG